MKWFCCKITLVLCVLYRGKSLVLFCDVLESSFKVANYLARRIFVCSLDSLMNAVDRTFDSDGPHCCAYGHLFLTPNLFYFKRSMEIGSSR